MPHLTDCAHKQIILTDLVQFQIKHLFCSSFPSCMSILFQLFTVLAPAVTILFQGDDN